MYSRVQKLPRFRGGPLHRRFGATGLAPAWCDNPPGVEIRPEKVVIGSCDQLRHIAYVKLWIVNSKFIERSHIDFSPFQLLLTLEDFINPDSTYIMIFHLMILSMWYDIPSW